MNIKATRHTSTDLEQISDKIEQILKDNSAVFDNALVDVDSMTPKELKAFAERGGLGACVSKADVLAETSEDLMYLSGERIVVLKHIKNDTYLGYCEGVIGKFNAENVHFVELDPRVLESLDAELTFAGDRYSSSESWTRGGRNSVQSYYSSTTSDPASIPDKNHLVPGGRSSIESLQRPTLDYTTKAVEEFDTSAFNDDYSSIDEEAVAAIEEDPVAMDSSGKMLRSTTIRGPRAATKNGFDTVEDETNDGDDEDEPGNESAVPSRNGSLRGEEKSKPAAAGPDEDDSTVVDEYGFIVEGEGTTKSKARAGGLRRADSSAKSMKVYREQEIKWLNIVSKMDAGTVKKDAKLKKLVRSGIPASVRAKVWQFLAGSQDYKKPGMYQNLCSRPRTKTYAVIERDIARCYPDHIQFRDEDGQGQQDLGDVLKAYSQYNSELGYCQGMGRLAGCMLMHMTAEDSFWLLVATIDRYMNGYFTPSLSQLRIDAYIIGELLKDHHPKLAQHLEENEVQPIMYIAQWFLTAFTMTLPWSSVLRVWDVFYFEGVKVFYRISLAILEICKDHLLNSCPTNSELLSFLLHIPHEYLGPEVLLDTAFRIKLSKTDIRKYAKKASNSATSDAMGLPFEDGLKNLMVSTSGTSTSLGTFKGLGGKIMKKNSSLNVNSTS